MVRDSINVYGSTGQTQYKYIENTELNILIKCKFLPKLKVLKTHEGWKSKGLRNVLCEIVLGNLSRMVMLSGVRRVVSHQKLAWVQKD